MHNEQLSLPQIPQPELVCAVPQPGSREHNLLKMMAAGMRVTQPKWIEMGRGWRLAASAKSLGYLGWPVTSEWREVAGFRCKAYSLHGVARREANRLLAGGVNGN